jgi:hypothetical protein
MPFVLLIVRSFERDLDPYIIQAEFTALESKLGNGEITVKEFIEGLGCSDLYVKEFYAPYPNTKVIELGTKHFLGRAPLTSERDSEIQPNSGNPRYSRLYWGDGR